jgi:Flp pilus assembly protein CpaB
MAERLRTWGRLYAWLALTMVLVGVGVWAGLRYLAAQQAAAARAAPKVAVWVVTAPVAANTPILPADVKAEVWPAALVPPGRYVGAVAGLYAAEALDPGEPLLAAQVYRPASRDLIASRLPPGDVAVDLAVGPTNGVDGVIAPGDRVSVLATVPAGTDGPARTVLFLRHVAVLAVNGSLNAVPTPGQGEQLILAVTPTVAEALVFAQSHAALTVVLERPGAHYGPVPAYGAGWPASP